MNIKSYVLIAIAILVAEMVPMTYSDAYAHVSTESPSIHTPTATELVYAVEKNDTKNLVRHLQRYADPNTAMTDGLTPLITAAHFNNLPAALALIEHGADISFFVLDENGMRHTPIIYASVQGSLQVLTLLIYYGAIINPKDTADIPPVIMAAKKDRADAIHILWALGANLDVQDKFGATALMYAAAKGYEETLRFLLEHGVNTHTREEDGLTALEIAVREQQWEAAGLIHQYMDKE